MSLPPLETASKSWLQANRRTIARYAIAVGAGIVLGFLLRGYV